MYQLRRFAAGRLMPSRLGQSSREVVRTGHPPGYPSAAAKYTEHLSPAGRYEKLVVKRPVTSITAPPEGNTSGELCPGSCTVAGAGPGLTATAPDSNSRTSASPRRIGVADGTPGFS